MAVFTGAGVALVTPLKKDKSIDYDKLDELIEFHCNNQTDSIVICGTSGEASTLTEKEHMDCVKFTVERTRGRIPVIAGTGSNSTRTAMELTALAASYGVDGVLVVTPYYNKATQQGLIAHFTQIAEVAKVPVLLYHIPGRTGVTMQPETVAKLVRNVENIVGIKEASGNISRISKMMALTDGKLDLYSGNDDQIVPLMSVGGLGVISVLSNIAPRETHDICRLYLEGKVKESRNLQLHALPLIEALFSEVNPIPVKKAVELMGLCDGVVREPLTELEHDHAEKLRIEMEKFGIL
uniref:4-hydroxy-tetrahydrodipicolinate synthase n=1 Tax=Enterocloster clostridioformis TaxID=1531 RepID=UPI0025A603F9|nr:4-hydroxy-tetrahydrodipicolinate synthase [Enterocloster clostridioformis]